ncbi:GNAT family N-acetyltransferase [Amylibacter kogurei]|uniref:GNAT family N-acetyltransferase n=1 Tax=Paramylibacter kogurei TaxID=1889778 RepID=A0A2G5K7R3_9RHOB|nr:GNAT family protein [Amylibacter kogurei]PIB25062.1 GNAT family N-acetyltransferase [Amylibacter kogurei]
MFLRAPKVRIEAPRLYLRLPEMADHLHWVALREQGVEFLRQWEPDWASNHFSKRAFQNRVYWARKSFDSDDGMPLFLMNKENDQLMGAITLDNIRRGPAQAGTIGYWIGQEFARAGYMTEAINAVVNYAFAKMDLSRIEAATLPENAPSRGVLEKTGFKYEGVAQSYLQINGRWRTHVLYANLRNDRRGKTDAG